LTAVPPGSKTANFRIPVLGCSKENVSLSWHSTGLTKGANAKIDLTPNLNNQAIIKTAHPLKI
jgi:hypothetical protein